MNGERTTFINDLSGKVIGAAIEVHRELGPGLLESVYPEALAAELIAGGLSVAREVVLPVFYKGRALKQGLRLDLLIEGQLMAEVKAIDALAAIHSAQLLTYLRLASKPIGLLLNFNFEIMRLGVKRIVNQR